MPALDLADVPFPIAYPLAYARDSRLSVSERLDNALFAAYQAMRVTALLLLADYLACETISPRLTGPISGLRMPHWGEWLNLCRHLVKFWNPKSKPSAGDPERQTYFPQLVDGWRSLSQDRLAWAPLLADLLGLQGQARDVYDALQKLRNDRAHRQATRTPDSLEDADRLPRMVALVEALARTLFPPGGFVLWRRVDDRENPLHVFSLHGPHPDLRFKPEPLPADWAGAFTRTDLVARTQAVGVPIYPLFVPLDPATVAHPVGGGGLVEPVALVNDINEREVLVLGVRNHAELPELVEPIQSALERKQVSLKLGWEQVDRWNLVSWATVTAQDAVSELRGRKYFPEVYVERPGIDDKIATVLDRPGRGLLLLGVAGSGKSSLLARLVERLTAAAPTPPSSRLSRKQREKRQKAWASPEGYLEARGEGDLVLFLSGRGAYGSHQALSGRTLLCEAVLNRAGVKSGEFVDLTAFIARLAKTAGDDRHAGRRVWLILDALNEADRFTDLVQALDEFLPAVGQYPWLRLVVSMRSGAYQSLRQRHHDQVRHGPAVFANAHYWTTFDDDESQREQPYLQLRPFTPDEGRQAYALRQEQLPERSARIPWAQLSLEMRKLLCAPLYLHLFHEAFRGRAEAPATLDAAQLADAYLESLTRDMAGIADWLSKMGQLLYQTRQAVLPVTVANAWLAEWRGQLPDPMQWVVKLDPLEELVAASLLLRPAEEEDASERRLAGFVFTHQKLCEQVLLRELLRQIRPRTLPTSAEWLAWARQAAGEGDQTEFRELTGALAVLAARLVAAGKGEVLSALLDLANESVRTQVLGAALRALGPLWGARAEGESLAAGVLAALLEAAKGQPQRSERFYFASDQAQQWLRQSGYSLCAWALGQGRLAALRDCLRAEPEKLEWQREQASCLTQLADLAIVLGQRDTAQHYHEEAITLLHRLTETHPRRVEFQQSLAVSLRGFGSHLRELGRENEAKPHLEKSVYLLRKLDILKPPVYPQIPTYCNIVVF
ncbi:MAG: hypothetical protein P9E67_09895 [Candidatus Competibacter sp.]|nr:hypothetical protein [Candidatus Competibacter sp.]